ncbi:acetylornithine deacetylase [Labrys monachus]|uniref:Acetylornithine deacetylase n=1 Tax=Labrys monachus TaxID=217067 RepID=A0ABU0FLH7_9HYPH|nr:acetylornithine deacetylase [Labrys monachus]MDQ0395467.1 acetylornithine deacetylase [Labrys monachus]
MTTSTTREILADLVAFDTTSSRSNLPLIRYVRDYLAGFGIEAEIFADDAGDKANLWATIGPPGPGGFILSGHTDCVPVDGQAWTSPPFALTERDGRLYGRGSTDMKGFLASVLAAVPALVAGKLREPVHLAFSYDEEVGCTGVRAMIARLAGRGEKPAACLVGEPTDMRVVVGHKGGRGYDCLVTGSEAHSSLAPRAANAIEYAAELVVFIRRLAAELALGPADEEYDVVHSTISTGRIRGGTAVNIVPRTCALTFEFRNLAEVMPDAIFGRIAAYAEEELVPAMRRQAPEASIGFEMLYDYPAHGIDPAHPLVTRIKNAVGHNGHGKVAYGTEAGLFQRDFGVPTVVCGPGSIDVAHKPDESILPSQLDLCDAALRRLLLG